jgi:CheY-like chemotaxis protein
MTFARQTILLVEDDQNDVLLFQRAFDQNSPGKSIQVASTGESALAYLDGQGQFEDRRLYPLPALLFLDLKLPGMSGFEVLTWTRQQPRLKRMQIVVLTGSPLTIDIYRAYELGADSYLVKPVGHVGLDGLAKSLKLPWLMRGKAQKEEMASVPQRPG